MFVAINASTPSSASQLQRPRSSVAATMDSESLSPQLQDSPRNRGPSWTDDDKEKFQEIISSIGSTVGTPGAPSSYAQLFDLASKKLGEFGITKSSTQCKDKWYRMVNRAENEMLFNFTRGRSKHGTFGEDKLEVEEPEAEEAQDSSFVQDEDLLNATNGDGDENMADANEGGGHRSTVRWDDKERDALIDVVKARRELELKDDTLDEFNAGQLFAWASGELKARYSIERTRSSCMIFWRRNIAGTRGFGTGNDATKIVPNSTSTNGIRSAKTFEDTPSMTLRETPTKSKRLQNSLQPQSPKVTPKAAPKATPKATSDPRSQSPKLGRKFTQAQKDGLAREAENGLNPSAEVRARLVQELNLTGQQVSGYFGNARFKARKMKSTGPKEGGEEVSENEEVSSLSITAAPDSGVKTRRYRKRKRSGASIDSDDEPLLTPSVKQASEEVASEEKVYGSRPGMLKRKAPMRDPSLPLLPPPSYEDSMLKASPNPYGSPLNPPHLSRSSLPRDPPRSSSSRLSLDPATVTSRDASNASLPGDFTPNTATASSTSAGTTNIPPNPPNPADDQMMETILASKVSRIDEEVLTLSRKIEDETSAIQADEQEIIELDRRTQEIQARKDVVLAARQEKNVNRAGYSTRIQVLGNKKAQIAKALSDLKAAMEDDV
ncbi:hypothetical protein BKA65DRAFT_115744 [Rhexocercosporidium sp. MPI-PUGE-AT-0058]|nr:hypothetical protein BKA65DRAFT_115744 [Rhexocercosporidium sp. MPI-PUGE-AT-0058]